MYSAAAQLGVAQRLEYTRDRPPRAKCPLISLTKEEENRFRQGELVQCAIPPSNPHRER
ncbi:hypothetical protein M441DRAFT_59290, partial [Trichoderma asperellum CBS 433.97]